MTTTDSDNPDASTRRRVLFVAEAVTLAHVARPVVLAQSLDPAQFDVHLATDPRYDKLFLNLPFKTHPIHSIPSEQFREALAKGTPVYSTQTLCDYAQQDIKLIEELKPDLIVGDFRLSLAISTRLTHTPYMTVTNAYWSPYADIRFQVPELPFVKILGVTIGQAVFNIARPPVFALHTIPMNRARKKFGLPSLGRDLRHVYTYADHTLYADLPELVAMKNLPANHHFLGPVQWSPKIDPPDWWSDLPKDKPVIYVTLGSSGQTDLLGVILQGLADLPVTVVAATAGRGSLKNVSSNALVADYLPGADACQRASLVVCNGGSPTTYQALVAGKPVLAIPGNLDQYLNMQGILRLGAGQLIRAGKVTAGAVRGGAQPLLDDSNYTHVAERFGRYIQGYDSSRLFADLVRGILNHHPTHRTITSYGKSAESATN